MKTILRYLLDQGGQFWGAFAQSYANSVEKARDRPLKEAMMKANIAHQQAVADKAQMDIEQERQRNVALQELSNILQPKSVTTPGQKDATFDWEKGDTVTSAPTTTMKMPDFKSPEVQGALIKAQPKEAATQMLKQLGPTASKFGVDTLEEAQQMEQDPNFRQMFSHGWRWTSKNGKLVPEGINPVNAADNAYHAHLSKNPGDLAGARAAREAVLYGGGAASGAGQYAGKTGQEIQQPIAPMQPFAPTAPTTAPLQNVGTPTQTPTPAPTGAPLPGETPEATKQRIRKQAQLGATPLPEEAQKAQAAASKIGGQADMLLKGFTDKEIDEFSGVFQHPKNETKSYINAAGKALNVGQPFEKAQRDRFSAFQVALANLKQVAFDVGGKQLTPYEASVVFGYIPTGKELNGGTEIKQKIENLKTILKAGADVRLQLAREGRSNIDPTELDKLMQQELAPIVEKMKAGQPVGESTTSTPQASGGENVIHHPTGDYIVRGTSIFKVK